MKTLDIGAALSKGFDNYTSNFVPLFLIALGVNAVYGLVVAAIFMTLASGAWALAIIVGLLGIALSIVVATVLQGMYVMAAADMEKGESLDVGNLIERVKPFIGAIIVTSLIAGLGILGGMILFIIPGIILAVWWTFIGAIVVLEGKSGTDALGRSKELVSGIWWYVLGLVVITSLITGIGSSIVGGILGGLLDPLPDFIEIFIGQAIPGALFTPISALVMMAAYFQLAGQSSQGTQAAPAPVTPSPVEPAAPAAPTHEAPAAPASPDMPAAPNQTPPQAPEPPSQEHPS